MADVTGPISSLPNSSHDVPQGTMCDNHPDRPAVVRKQGETDSFGSEMYDLCEECVDEWNREAREADTSGTCDWCHNHKPARWPQRDYEEGLHGRVYYVCEDCTRKRKERLQEEYDYSFSDADDEYVDDDDPPDDEDYRDDIDDNP